MGCTFQCGCCQNLGLNLELGWINLLGKIILKRCNKGCWLAASQRLRSLSMRRLKPLLCMCRGPAGLKIPGDFPILSLLIFRMSWLNLLPLSLAFLGKGCLKVEIGILSSCKTFYSLKCRPGPLTRGLARKPTTCPCARRCRF
jgi:hypothetical protein